METSNRNQGIDTLRIISMLMVVSLHVIIAGGGNSDKTRDAFDYLYVICACAVDCFALISGYVGIQRKQQISNIVFLWIRVILLTLLTNLFFLAFYGAEIGLKEWIHALLPVYFGQYWYFTAYFALFLIMPILNAAVNNINKEKMLAVIVAMAITFSVLPTFFIKDSFEMSDGYSTWWLATLYIIGAYIGKYGLLQNLKRRFWACLILASSLVIIGFSYAFRLCDLPIGENVLKGYMSPFVVSEALGFLMLFSNYKPRQNAGKIISIIAPSAFGVYIIHRNRLFWETYIKGSCASFLNDPLPMIMGKFLVIVFVIYIGCTSADFVVNILLNALKIKPTLRKLEVIMLKKIHMRTTEN